MATAFDDRIIQVGLEIDGQQTVFQGPMDIRAIGQKMASPTAGMCQVKISNMTAQSRNYLLTKSSPVPVEGRARTPVNLTLDVGRKSYGTFRLFEGAVWASGATQPPDIGVMFESLTNNLQQGIINAQSFGKVASLKTIAQAVANQNGLALNFMATDKQVGNYAFTGAVNKQVAKIQQAGNYNAFVDNGTLVVLDVNQTKNEDPIIISASTGMVGVPLANESGLALRTMVNNQIELCSKVQVVSEKNPGADGIYKVWQIGYDIATRTNSFYYNLILVPPNTNPMVI